MNPPQIYMCSPSWTLLPPPSPYHPSGSSQCTSPKHPVSCIEPGLATRFIHDILHVSMPFSQNSDKFFLILTTTDYKGTLLEVSTRSEFQCLALSKELENCINKSEKYLLITTGEVGPWNIPADTTQKMIKVNITSNKIHCVMVPDVPKKWHGLTSVVFLPKMYAQKSQYNHWKSQKNLKTFYKIVNQYSPKVVRSW